MNARTKTARLGAEKRAAFTRAVERRWQESHPGEEMVGDWQRVAALALTERAELAGDPRYIDAVVFCLSIAGVDRSHRAATGEAGVIGEHLPECVVALTLPSGRVLVRGEPLPSETAWADDPARVAAMVPDVYRVIRKHQVKRKVA